MGFLVTVSDFGEIFVIADNISQLDNKLKEAGIYHYEIEKSIDIVL